MSSNEAMVGCELRINSAGLSKARTLIGRRPCLSGSRHCEIDSLSAAARAPGTTMGRGDPVCADMNPGTVA